MELLLRFLLQRKEITLHQKGLLLALPQVSNTFNNMQPGTYNDSIFINCPFDQPYIPILRALVFAIYRCGFVPKSALVEDNALDNRLDKIERSIENCRYGVHDISRTELNNHNLPRFNMLTFAKVIEQHVSDSLLRVAVLSSNEGSGPKLLKVLIDRGIFLKDTSSTKSAFTKDLCYVIGARNDEKELLSLTELLSRPEIKNKTTIQLACLEGLGNGLEKAENKNKSRQALITALEKNLPQQNEEIKAAIKKINQAKKDTP